MTSGTNAKALSLLSFSTLSNFLRVKLKGREPARIKRAKKKVEKTRQPESKPSLTLLRLNNSSVKIEPRR